eukprot:TRINITY_DN16428_c0_g1_i2.p1 TRINITY_DN16428_c0_g1~~TRINITY_DN16428_c0_g1_i2.p1  ORF type:complete len:530 (+),score=71.35 TRINITY_DN16428_c0_g1_i2:34-1590(+)
MSTTDEVQVDTRDVVRLMMQYCSENGLQKTFDALKAETGITMDTVPDKAAFLESIRNGHWDTVLRALSQMTLPAEKLYDLYEHIIAELVELRETDLARRLLRETNVIHHMLVRDPIRHTQLEQMVNSPFFDTKTAYKNTTKEARRATICASLATEVSTVQPNRLLSLLNQALLYQRQAGTLPTSHQFDLFKGSAVQQVDDCEIHPSRSVQSIKFGDKTYAEVAAFSPDGEYFITGSSDGFLEVWDIESGKIRLDLPYQKSDNFMMHSSGILSMAFSTGSELLASGSVDGQIRVWRPKTGALVKKFEKPHEKGITALHFTHDSSQIISCSFDGVIRLHGLKSGKLLKEYRGHTSYVNDITIDETGTKLLSCSSDGSCKIWDIRSMDLLSSFTPPATIGDPPSCYRVAPIASSGTQLFAICSRTSHVNIINLKGQLVDTLRSGKRDGGELVAFAVSPKREWLYCVGEDKLLYCFNLLKKNLEHTLMISEKDVIGLVHHPHRNCVATWGQDACVRFWVPSE